MTENERFTMVCMGEDLLELNDNGIYKVFNDIGLEKLLNEQHETIQRLKQNINELLSVDIEEELLKENKQLKHRLAISEKAKYVTALAGENKQLKQENKELKEELDYWKKRALLLEKKYNEGDTIKWLRENTVWEQMPSNKRTFITTNTKEDYK